MKTRKELDKYFEDCVSRFVDSIETRNELAETCHRRYGMKVLRCIMILTGGAATNEVSEVELFWILQCINSVVPNANCDIKSYFSENKIAEYDKARYEEEKVKFPIKISMIASGEDKWIGIIDAQTITKWRNAGLLRYNKNIQRRVKTVLRGGKYVEAIDLNLDSVNKMIPLFKEGKFISNVLTFNLNELADFYYDPDEKEIVIENLQCFDMTDGYHRLVALEKIIEEDPNFNYLMEMRLTCFSEEKANFFIWQEEQRTPMKKSSIKSYNMDDLANKITKKINESTSCNLSGNIRRGGLVNFSTFADCLDYYFLKDLNDKERKLAIVKVPKEIIDDINILTDANPDILTWKFGRIEILVMMFVFKNVTEKEKLPIVFAKMLDYNYENNKRILYNGTYKLANNILKKVYDEVSHV